MTDKVQECRQNLLEAIRESDVCRQYEECKEQISLFPEKLAAVNRFRKRNYEFQNNSEAGDEEIAEQLAAEKKALTADPLLKEYLDTELALCRLLQNICIDIMNVTDMQLNDR